MKKIFSILFLFFSIYLYANTSEIVITKKFYDRPNEANYKYLRYTLKERQDLNILWRDIESKDISTKDPIPLEMQLLDTIESSINNNESEDTMITKIKNLVSNIKDINFIYKNIENNPIGYALKNKKYKLAKFLVSNGASINLVDCNFGIISDMKSPDMFSSFVDSKYEEEGNSLVSKIIIDSNKEDIYELVKQFHSLGLSSYVFNESSLLNLIIKKHGFTYNELKPIINLINNLYPSSINYSTPNINKLPLEQLTYGEDWISFHPNTLLKLPTIQFVSSKEFNNLNNFKNIVDHLISLGGKIDSNPGYNLTPFALACVYNVIPEKCEYFLNKNIDLNIKSVLNKKENALIRYVSYYNKTPSKYKEYFKDLINKNIELNTVNSNNDTALSIAIQKKKFFEVKTLIENGADITIMNDDGYVAIDIAEKIKHKKMVELIKNGVSGKQTGLDKLLSKRSSQKNYNSYALIIGINEYKNETNVAYADNSAKSFKLLSENVLGIPKENIIYLTNENATSGQIKSNIQLISQLVEKGNTLYFYYAGHGVPGTDGETYILPSDMKGDNIHIEKSLSIKNIYKTFLTSPAKDIIVFMDSCFSGKNDKGELLYKGVAPILKKNKVLVDNSKLSVFSAGGQNDFANQYAQEEQRMFSYFLIKGILDGNINSEELSNYIRVNVKRNSLKLGLGYKQVPEYNGKTSFSLY